MNAGSGRSELPLKTAEEMQEVAAGLAAANESSPDAAVVSERDGNSPKKKKEKKTTFLGMVDFAPPGNRYFADIPG